jgi:hypothetical protein
MATVTPASALYPNGPSNDLGNIPLRGKRFESKDENVADPSELTRDQNIKAPTIGSHIDTIIRAAGVSEDQQKSMRAALKTKFANAGLGKETERMPFFNPDVADIQGANPNKLPFGGTPAEIYNSYREQGLSHDQSVAASKRYVEITYAEHPEWAKKYVQKPEGVGDEDMI